jgi:SNF2 family DNA or RNA helicase
MAGTSAQRPPLGEVSPRELLGRGNQLGELARDVMECDARLHGQVRRAFAVLRKQMVRRELATIPVSRLRETTEGRLRLGPLEQAGFRTVLAILDAKPHHLRQIPSVGDTTATQAIAAARQIAAAVEESLKVRIDLDPANPHSTALLVALHELGQVDPIVSRMRGPAQQLDKELRAVLPYAAPAANRLRMLFAGRKRRDEARRALARVQQLLEWSDGTGLSRDLPEANAHLRPAPAQPATVWKDFEQRSPEYYGRLGEIVDLRLDIAAAEGFLPAEIVARVQDQQLDDRFRRVSLRGYQSFGARFALVQRRVIIGDEMGLGKTIEAIAALAHLKALGRTHFLVVCPASVLINWTREITARSDMRAYRLHGVDRTGNLNRWIQLGDIGVTTFDALRALAVPADLSVAMLVVDEAHYVKNPRARRSEAVRTWTERAQRVLFLTGTPMENRVEEFRNLVTYLQPDLVSAVKGTHAVAGPVAFRKAVAPVYLRRNQEDVLAELPDLVRTDEWVEFDRHDSAAYRAAVLDGNFMAMRRAAYAPATPAHSAKLERLVELVGEAAANGRKVVVYSFFREVLATVASNLGERAFGPLTGSLSPATRQDLVDQFSRVDGHAALVSQIQAGGVGLNIQAASIVIICEPQVKPTTEEQAIARCHRMGQVRSVQVHRLLVANSVDQRMLEILEAKAKLFDEYARRSDIAEATPDAVDISDGELARQVVELEQERLAREAIAAQDAFGSTERELES